MHGPSELVVRSINDVSSGGEDGPPEESDAGGRRKGIILQFSNAEPTCHLSPAT